MAKSFDALAKKTMTAASRRRASRRANEILTELHLAELRQRLGTSQKEIARRLGIRQPTLSRLENQGDMQIASLRRIIEAMGGELEITARFPKGGVTLRPFSSTRQRATRHAHDAASPV
ncbi:MAG: XRE family transcriptional regulator [Phycisphaeraceae bacterium]|nr:XRE family transcriptional regulator [Phycisphaeraceae bacterium]